MNTPQAQRLIDFFESLDSTSLDALGDYFSESARFRDPFNDVRGVDAIRAIFEHMFETVDHPRFRIDECVGGDTVYMRWQFHFDARGEHQVIDGVSRIVFAGDGRVVDHQDFWDPAQHIYERVPLLGSVLRALRRRLGAPQSTCPDNADSEARRCLP